MLSRMRFVPHRQASEFDLGLEFRSVTIPFYFSLLHSGPSFIPAGNIEDIQSMPSLVELELAYAHCTRGFPESMQQVSAFRD